jgi:hypothetical protein
MSMFEESASTDSVADAIARANDLLPGVAAADGETDPRWQAIIAVGEFVESNPDEVWEFAARWGVHPDDDLQAAIATCVLEHLLEHHFDHVFPRAEQLARENGNFAETLRQCWRFGQATHPANGARLEKLRSELDSDAGTR